MSVKENIYLYLESKGVTPTKAERLMGWSVGALTKANSITAERLKEFILFNKDVSPEWILTGKGDMLKKLTGQEASESVSNLEIEKSFLEKEFFYLKAIKDKNEDLIKAMETIEMKDKEILKLKSDICSLNEKLNKQQAI